MKPTGTIGIVGGGQLAQMMIKAARPFNFKFVVIDSSVNCPAAQVGAEEIITKTYGIDVIKELAGRSDFIGVEFDEILDEESLIFLEELAEKKPVNPAPQTIRMIQDKLKQKEFLKQNGVPVGPFAAFSGGQEGLELLHRYGGKMMVKTRRGGYDGHGNRVVENEDELQAVIAEMDGRALYAEAFVPFRKELAVMVARSTSGATALYPITETVHVRNICSETLSPAQITSGEEQAALAVAQSVAEHLKGAGVFGVEMFLTNEGEVLVNEISPRVHNSGHYTIEACETSQFEQHVRAITGMPLGRTSLKVPAAVMVNILGERNGPVELKGLEEAEAIPGVHVHIYGKTPTKIDRKMGHITATGKTINEALENARHARKLLSI